MAGNELFTHVEFDDVFPRKSLKDTLEPLSTKTGIQLFEFYNSPRASWSESTTDIPDLSPYFDSHVKGRHFLECLQVPDPETRIPLDYMMMEEKIREGVDVLTVFAVPPPGDPFWHNIDIGEGIKTKLVFLKAKGVFLILSDLDDPYNANKKEATEITAPLFVAKKPKIVGFLSGKQENSTAGKFDCMASERYALFKDRPPFNLNLLSKEFLVGVTLTDEMRKEFEAAVPDLRVATPQGVKQTKYLGSIWGNVAAAASLNYLLTKGIVHEDPIRGPKDMKKFERLFLESCVTFFMEDL